MKLVRLTRKYCQVLNGFDLSAVSIGQMFLVDDDVSVMLLREGWVEPATEAELSTCLGSSGGVLTDTITPHRPSKGAERARSSE